MDLRTRKSRRQARRPFPPPEPGADFIVFKTRVARGGNVNPAPFDGRVVRVSAVSFADAPAATSEIVQHRKVRFARIEADAGLLEGRVWRGVVNDLDPNVAARRGRVVRDTVPPQLMAGRAWRRQPIKSLEDTVTAARRGRMVRGEPDWQSILTGRVVRPQFLIQDPPAIVGQRPRATQIATLVPIEIIDGSGRVRRGKTFTDPVVDAIPIRRVAAGDPAAFEGRVRRGRNFHTGLEGFPDPCPERPPVVEEDESLSPVVEMDGEQPPFTDEADDTPPKFTDECR